METKKLLVIDSNALVHRAYHALPPLKTKKGELVNAVYGFCLIFLRALKEFRPDFVAAAFDLPGPTFRHKEFKGYKAKRPKAPEELYQQIEGVKKVLAAFQVPIFEKQGFEADDLIGTIASQAERRQVFPKIETTILSGDLDTLQLVNPQTKVYTMRKGIKDTVLYDVEKVKERYNGLTPAQLLDFKALRGDPSDNIPGVTGIGEKTAIQLLRDFSTLENLYQEIEKESEKASKIKQGVLQKLKDYKEQAFFSKKLAQIHCDVPVDFKLKACQLGEYDREKVEQVFKDFEFYTLLPRLSEVGQGAGRELKVRPSGDLGLTLKETGKQKGLDLTFRAYARNVKSLGKELVQQIDDLQKRGVFSEKIAETEKALIPVIQQMEKNGIKVDPTNLGKLSEVLARELAGLEEKIEQQSGEKFNINSPQQLSKVLFEKLKIPIQGLKKTPGGVISTGAGELEKLKDVHPVVALILQYRELFKLKSGFVDVLPKFINPEDGRVHPHFNQLGTETGRLSCSEPNLQNIPVHPVRYAISNGVKSEWGKEIRKCFVAGPGFLFLSADYSQMELRVVAALAQDEKMLEFFRDNKDIHKMTAAEIFELPEEKVNKEQRKLAKTLNFGVLYGMGPRKFSENTGLSYEEAREFIDKYFSEFQGIAEYLKNSIKKTREQGFSETLFGRKRFLPEINSRDARLRAQAERMARNFPAQGTAADIIKMAMNEINNQLSIINNPDCKMLLQIHDELLFEVRDDKIKEVVPKIKEIMEDIVKLKVPLKVEMKVGKNWSEMEIMVE